MTKVLVEMDSELRDFLLLTNAGSKVSRLNEFCVALRAAEPAGDEFEVDWSKAPEWAVAHTFDANGRSKWWQDEPFAASNPKQQAWVMSTLCRVEENNNIPNWRESLRKRPQENQNVE